MAFRKVKDLKMTPPKTQSRSAGSPAARVVHDADGEMSSSGDSSPEDASAAPSPLPAANTTTSASPDAAEGLVVAGVGPSKGSLNRDYKRLQVGEFSRRFDTVRAALGNGIGRRRLTIQDDDVAAMNSGSQPEEWVQKLGDAFCHDLLETPEDVDRSQEQKEYFLQWQIKSQRDFMNAFGMKGRDHLEQCCWYLFDAVIKTHELGYPTIANNWAPSSIKCSARLALIPPIIEKYAIVRRDIIFLRRIEEIAANPEAYEKRKLAYELNNGNRSIDKKKADAKAKNEEKQDEGGEKAKTGARAVVESIQDRPQPQQGTAESSDKGKEAPLSQTPGKSEAAVVDGTSGNGSGTAKQAKQGGEGSEKSKSKSVAQVDAEMDEERPQPQQGAGKKPLPSQTQEKSEVDVVAGTGSKEALASEIPDDNEMDIDKDTSSKETVASQTPEVSEMDVVDETGSKNKNKSHTKGKGKATPKRARSPTPDEDKSEAVVNKGASPHKRAASRKISATTGSKGCGGRKTTSVDSDVEK